MPVGNPLMDAAAAVPPAFPAVPPDPPVAGHVTVSVLPGVTGIGRFCTCAPAPPPPPPAVAAEACPPPPPPPGPVPVMNTCVTLAGTTNEPSAVKTVVTARAVPVEKASETVM